MKILIKIFLASLLATATAQQLAPPKVAADPKPPKAKASPTPLEPDEASPTPAQPPALPDLAELDRKFQQSSMGQAAEEHRLRVEWRKLKNRTTDDPDIVAARTAAEQPSTDFERRKRLRKYYELYYDRMRGLASTVELKNYIDGMKAAHINALTQARVRPEATP